MYGESKQANERCRDQSYCLALQEHLPLSQVERGKEAAGAVRSKSVMRLLGIIAAWYLMQTT
jgi:hypothetical protein